MKINWGTGIFIAFVLFISFILFFVIKATTQKEFAYDLVEEDYYKTEIKYQDEIDKLQNASELSKKIEIITNDGTLKFVFPQELIANKTTGKAYFYRASKKALDFEIPISFKKDTLEINSETIVSGNWSVKIKFNSMGKEYIFKKSIQL